MSADSFVRWRQTAPSYGLERRIRPEQARTLSKWLYVLAITGAGVWTLLMWGAYGILSLGDDALRAGSAWLGVDTQWLAQLQWAIGGAQQFGEAVVLIVWGLGIAAIALCGWLGRSLIRAFTSVEKTIGRLPSTFPCWLIRLSASAALISSSMKERRT